jgi:hypothetical protein
VVVGVRNERLAGRAGEHPALLPPELARLLAFPLLLCPVGTEQRYELWWQSDRAPAGLGLHFARSCPRDLALRAVAGLLTAGAVAAVRVLWPQPRAADAKDAVVQVHILPAQTQRLPLPQSQRQGQSPPGAVALPTGHIQQPLDLINARESSSWPGRTGACGKTTGDEASRTWIWGHHGTP